MKPNKFCQVSPVIVSGDVFGEVLLRFGDFMKLLFTMFLFTFGENCYQLPRGSTHPDDRGHDPKEANFFSLSITKKEIENPFPSCRYRRSNGG